MMNTGSKPRSKSKGKPKQISSTNSSTLAKTRKVSQKKTKENQTGKETKQTKMASNRVKSGYDLLSPKTIDYSQGKKITSKTHQHN